jgi:hypothetical protein
MCVSPRLPLYRHLHSRRYDEWFKKMHNFDDYLVTKGQLQNAREPEDPLHNPYTYYHKQEGTPVWAIMSQDAERFQTFQTGMAGIDLAIPVVGHFDFSSLKNSPEEEAKGVVELVDVGGGHGAVLKKILDTHPELSPKNCVLQDRSEVIELSKRDDILPAEVQRQEHDFMTEQPVKGTFSNRPHHTIPVP